MPIKLNFLERLAMLKLNIAPAPFLDIAEAMVYWNMCTAFELGIFETLKDGHLTVSEIAKRINASEAGIEMLLKVLESTGYVIKNEEKYYNSPMSEKWMLKDSPQSLAGIIPFHKDIMELWKYLGESIKKGSAVVDAGKWLLEDPLRAKNYHDAMLALARISCDEVIECAKLPNNAKKLIDIGGCHGLYSVRFCQKYPELTATVLDCKETHILAEKTINTENISDRVKFSEGDFFKDNITEKYDVALLFNTLHMFNPDKSKELLKKIFNTLNPEGIIILMEETTAEFSKGFGQTLLRLQAMRQFNSIGGQVYSFAEISELLSNIGFHDTQTIILKKSIGTGLIIAKK